MIRNKKLSRLQLLQLIRKKAHLSTKGSSTLGYFTKKQLKELLIYLEKNEDDWNRIETYLEDLKKRALALNGEKDNNRRSS